MIAYADLVVAFPELGGPDFAAPQAAFWIGQGYNALNAYRLGTQLDYAVMLYAAHNLVLSVKALKSAVAGASIGDAAGAVQTKTVGGVTVGYDTQGASIEGAGQWNATIYGQRLYPLLRGASAGPAYVGTPYASFGHRYGSRGFWGGF